jgi:hypothetical protein
VLLRKMLKIDLKGQNPPKPPMKPESNPKAWNQYNSLNRKVRIENLTRIVNDNRSMLSRLQSAKSHYNREQWEAHFVKHKQVEQKIHENSNRFTRNPYFLHSVCTPNEQSGMAPKRRLQSANAARS